MAQTISSLGMLNTAASFLIMSGHSSNELYRQMLQSKLRECEKVKTNALEGYQAEEDWFKEWNAYR